MAKGRYATNRARSSMVPHTMASATAANMASKKNFVASSMPEY